jgi:hypothetical protein
MKNEIKLKMTYVKSNIEQLLDEMDFKLCVKLGTKEARELSNSIASAALLDADNIRKEALIAVVKLSTAIEVTTQLLADAQKRLEEADRMFAEFSVKKPEA